MAQSAVPAVTRREALRRAAVLTVAIAFADRAAAVAPRASDGRWPSDADRRRLVADADRYLTVRPRTTTSAIAPRSPGGPKDYYSEADYWWPDPANPAGPYVRRDGLSNPDKFDAHRDAMIELSLAVPALVAAWRLTGDRRYARHAETFLDAWFVDPATAMNPNLQYAQAIIGVNTGRGIGVIDTLHLVEVAQAVMVLEGAGGVAVPARFGLTHDRAIRDWFAAYLQWLTTSSNGTEERDERNNHGTCWALQAAAFARLTGDTAVIAFCADRFRERLIPDQIAPDGSQPLELARTKPFGYALFNLDALAALARIASTPGDDLWRFATPDGRSLAGALAFLYPFLRDKRTWPYPHDVEYFDQWPIRHVSLLFGAEALHQHRYRRLWRELPPLPPVREVIRNVPLRQPTLWM
ncbi:alginate lyase family protein [Sphingomonas sp. VNH70]|uniref:alginate lyase family protein n=1 Tax=Sphingomonas silueang TaxID=3156617 RepID=UPI0032B54FBE